MFDPDDYELHEAQKHACKMAKERDEARVMADRLTEELAKCAAVLPGTYYMDPPDGGDVPVSEQLRRMAKDAERYRYLRRKVAAPADRYRGGEWPWPETALEQPDTKADVAKPRKRSKKVEQEAPGP